ncbi:MAG: 2OG-Fe(II) oxygenase [Pseudomonadota bacterium]|nr:2OG-Fe(II) oxygenase [Pseudomonadota bacterium]
MLTKDKYSYELQRSTLRNLPSNFNIYRAGDTGVSIVENFCTSLEATMLISKAKPFLVPSQIRSGRKNVEFSGRISDTAMVFGPERQDQSLIPLMSRAAMLVGLPYTHLESLVVTRYGPGGFYEQHIDHGKNFRVDRLYTVLLYLNTLDKDQGGETIFQSLNLATQPRVGRAVTWVNKNPDGSGHLETNHAAAPIKEGSEKWVVQFWFHAYKMFSQDFAESALLTNGDNDFNRQLPDGVSIL